MTTPLRVGLIGAGVMGRHHLAVAAGLPDFVVAAVADPTSAARERFAGRDVQLFDDHRRMLDEAELDAVIVATPNAWHVPAALDCISRGLATLIEKPVADSVEGVRQLEAALAENNAPVLIGHHRRHNPILATAARHIADGGVGRVTAAVGLWLRRKPDEYFSERWKLDAAAGGGVLLINTIHDVDCLRFLCGEVESVLAMTTGENRGNPVEDTAGVILRFSSGAIGTITVSDAVAPWCWEITSQEDPRFATVPENSYLICGSAGSIAVPTLECWTNAPNAGREAPFIRQRLHSLPAESMREQMKHFARVARREEAPKVSVVDAGRSLAVVLAFRKSAQTGALVRINDMYS